MTHTKHTQLIDMTNCELLEVTRELLAALERAAKDLQAIIDDTKSSIDPSFALDRVNAAIAKAKGE